MVLVKELINSAGIGGQMRQSRMEPPVGPQIVRRFRCFPCTVMRMCPGVPLEGGSCRVWVDKKSCMAPRACGTVGEFG